MSVDCAESLTIYDSAKPDPARIIKTFCDTFSRPMEKVDFVSTGRSLYVRFNSRPGSYSGSSLYYWAHYDFFNNTKFGEPIVNTVCDEALYAWKRPRGVVRSPLNTLIYKRNSGADLRCQYKFITDRRLFARVVIEVTAVSFKEGSYSTNACSRCHVERVDKLIVWEEKDKAQEPLACFCDDIPRPVRIISSGEQLNLDMFVLGQHSTTSYFKNPNPLFEANYEFAHGPLCGPIAIGPSADGELNYPHRNTVSYHHPQAQQGALQKCIWELKVAAQRDLWMHLDKARFGDKSCDSARIDVYLAGRLEPRFIICPDNVSLARDLPILSAAELGALENNNEPLPVLIQFTGDTTPGRNSFRLLWTELFHLPRNQDGNVARSFLRDGDCDFKCPGDASVCIPRHLVCNGAPNCPKVTRPLSLDAIRGNILENLQLLNIHDEFLERFDQHLNDESPELCQRTRDIPVPYVGFVVFVSIVILTILTTIGICCRLCCCRRRQTY